MRKGGKQELNRACIKAYEDLEYFESSAGVRSRIADKYRAVWAAYDNAFKIVYGEEPKYENK